MRANVTGVRRGGRSYVWVLLYLIYLIYLIYFPTGRKHLRQLVGLNVFTVLIECPTTRATSRPASYHLRYCMVCG